MVGATSVLLVKCEPGRQGEVAEAARALARVEHAAPSGPLELLLLVRARDAPDLAALIQALMDVRGVASVDVPMTAFA